MASQRLTMATIVGDAGLAVAKLFQAWRAAADAGRGSEAPGRWVDGFAENLRAHGYAPPVVYFAEWADHWLMGDEVPGPGKVAGRRFEATCVASAEAELWAGRCGHLFAEQQWLAARLREAARAAEWLAGPSVVVVLREVHGAWFYDDDIRATLRGVPAWLREQTADRQ